MSKVLEALRKLILIFPPISVVLSSDDEENNDDSKCRSKLVGEMASQVDAVVYRNSSKEAASQQEKALDAEDMQVGAAVFIQPMLPLYMKETSCC